MRKILKRRYLMNAADPGAQITVQLLGFHESPKGKVRTNDKRVFIVIDDREIDVDRDRLLEAISE